MPEHWVTAQPRNYNPSVRLWSQAGWGSDPRNFIILGKLIKGSVPLFPHL